jgi:hypothetical protein
MAAETDSLTRFQCPDAHVSVGNGAEASQRCHGLVLPAVYYPGHLCRLLHQLWNRKRQKQAIMASANGHQLYLAPYHVCWHIVSARVSTLGLPPWTNRPSPHDHCKNVWRFGEPSCGCTRNQRDSRKARGRASRRKEKDVRDLHWAANAVSCFTWGISASIAATDRCANNVLSNADLLTISQVPTFSSTTGLAFSLPRVSVTAM